jgi:hypothetical protein
LKRFGSMIVIGVVAGTATWVVASAVPVPVVSPIAPAMAAPALDCPAGPNAPVLVGSVYQVSTSAQLEYIQYNGTQSWTQCLDEHFVLTADINLGTNALNPWVPILGFEGTFDGAGKTISGLYATKDASDSGVGLFNTGTGATISNLNVRLDGFVSDPCCAYGGLIGVSGGDVTISAVTVTSTTTLSAPGPVGGLIGLLGGVTLINNSVVDVDVTAPVGGLGGLVGRGGGAGTTITINGSRVIGNLSAANSIGGLVGSSNSSSVTISGSSFNGAISASNELAGGLLGVGVYPVTIVNSEVVGDVTASSQGAGGLIGRSDSGVTITNSDYRGNVRVTGAPGEYAGGLVGAIGNSVAPTSITGSSVSGLVSATGSYVGGFLGFIDDGNVVIADGDVNGSVSGLRQVGGLIGTVDDLDDSVSITNTDVNATVTSANGGVGGMAGTAHQLSVVDSSFDGDVSIVNVGQRNLGGLAGSAQIATVSATTVTADLVGPQANWVGGFVGEVNGDATVSASTFTGNISAYEYVGGFFGSVFQGVSISDSESSGSFVGQSHVAGLVGWARLAATSDQLVVRSSSFEGIVSGTVAIGGLVGSAVNGPTTIEASTVDAIVSGTGESVGGFLGGSSSSGDPTQYTVTVADSSFTGNISASQVVGGLAGIVGGLFVSRSNRAQGSITASNVARSAAGGLVGLASRVTISATAFTGTVSAVSAVGGLVGLLSPLSGVTDASEISESYARATVVGSDTLGQNYPGAGGLIGNLWPVTASSVVAITNSFFNGSVTGSPHTGGLLGLYSNLFFDESFPIRITNTYAVGSFSAPSGSAISAFIGNEATVSAVTNSFCIDEVLCPIGSTTTSANLQSQSFLEAVGWNFSSTWCFSAGKNGGYPLLRNVTSGPPSNTQCWVYVPPPPTPPNSSQSPAPPTTVYRTSFDPAGGTCRAGGVSYSKPWSTTYNGSMYAPGPADCSRPGFDFKGWARTSAPSVVGSFPLLIDPSDGALRFFVAESVDVVVVWAPRVVVDQPGSNAPDIAPRSFLVFGNFLCTRCSVVWLIWQLPEPPDGMPFTESITGGAGRRLCTTGVVDVASWRACRVTELMPGRNYSFTLQLSHGSTSGSAVVSTITMRRR